MIKVIATTRRKPGMTRSEYFDYIEHTHGAMARAQPLTIKRYVQNHVFDSVYGQASDPTYQVVMPRDSVTELLFDDMAALGQCFGHPYVKEKVGPDGRNFADLSTSLSVITREHVLTPPPGEGGFIKAMHFIRKEAGVKQQEFEALCSEAHERAARTQQQPVAGLVRDILLPEGAEILKYFGGDGTPPYETVVSLYFRDQADAIARCRAYQHEFEDQADFMDRSKSFLLLAREVRII